MAAPQLWTLQSRQTEDSKPVTLPVLVERPEGAVKGVLISLDPGNNKDTVKVEAGVPTFGSPSTLVTRSRTFLLPKGIAVLVPGTPSDRPGGINFTWREGLDHQRDIEVLVAETHRQFPNVPVVLHGAIDGAASVLMAARARMDGIDGYAVTSGSFAWHRDDSLGRIKARGLVIHPISHRCDTTPTPEAREVAGAARWQFVAAGDRTVDSTPRCTTNSRAGLVDLDEPFADLLARWIVGEPVPDTLGKTPAALAYKDEIFVVPGATRTLFGKQNIEISLYTPPGTGPFPLLVFNHGDVSDGPGLSRRVRYRDMYITNEFLALGFAVAIPARPGVGRSEGAYQSFSGAGGAYIGPATGLLSKGKVHAEEAVAAMDFLRTLPQIDANRIVMSGQSAGGFAASCFGLMEPRPDWLKAIVNFSGGRTDTNKDGIAQGLNPGMVSAFGVLGGATKVPSLWIFAENDSRYSAETIRASYDAYTKAGGEAQLLLYPPSKGDGHFVYHEPEKWRAGLRTFLEKLALVKPLSLKIGPPPPSQSVPELKPPA